MAETNEIDKEKLRELLHEETLQVQREHQDTKDKLRWAEEERDALAESHAELVALVQRIGYDEELSYLACPGPPNCDGSHYDTCPVAIAQAAHAKARKL